MSSPFGLRARAGALVIVFGVGGPAVIALIAALPKSPEFAAEARLAWAMTVFAIAIIAMTGFSLSYRAYREAKMLGRYGSASSAVRDTLSYLKHERRLAAKGRLTALVGALVALALHVLAHWPQAAVLAPYRTAFGVLSVLLVTLVPVLMLRNRGHYINAFFIRRYLKQQLDHLGFKPGGRRKRKRRITEPAIVVTGAGCFSVNGFPFSFDDFVKNVVVFGQVGSGKTIAVLNTLLEGLIASFGAGPVKIGGLVLDAKGDFYGKIQTLCAKYGRDGSLCILDPSAWATAARTWRSIAWNPLDNNDDALEIATRLIAALRLIGMELGSEGSFFLDSAKAFLRHAITLVRAATITPAPSLIDVYRLSQESEETTPLYHQLINAIGARYPASVPAEITDAIAYFERELGPMADRQKSGLRGTITQLLDEFLVPPFREIFTEPSTLSIGDMIDQDKFLYVHMPASDRERMSRLVNTLIKLEYQRNILKRVGKSNPTFLLCDEFQTLYTAGEGRGDSDFFERSRESLHANIIAAQNVSAFMKRTKNAHDVKNFLGNCAVKIFLRQTEEETNRWASGLFGQRSEMIVTTSEQAALDGSWSRRRHTSYGRATRSLPRVPADAFARLAIPIKDKPDQQVASSIMHLASRGETQDHELDWPVNPLK
jgi:hypothetical protein